MKKEEEMQVKKGLEKEYEEYVKKNQDDYGNAIIIAGAQVGKSLSERKSCKEAHDKMYGFDLTGFMAGSVAQAITYFHPRGEEFKKFWNKKFDVEDVEGVVNPAILTIKEK